MVRKSIVLISIIFITLSCFSCQRQKEPIKIGISAWAGVEPAELAAQKGFYQQRGVSVQMVRFSAYTDSIEAFRKGRVDADMQTLDDAIRLFAEGKKMKVILFTDYSFGGDGIVAKAGIESVSDLKGKVIGVEIGTVGHFFLLKVLESAGLKEEEITIISIPAWKIKEAFLKGKIDAGVTWEPYLTSTAKEGGGKVIITSKNFPKMIVTTMVVSEKLFKERPKDVQNIILAYFDALNFIQKHPMDSYAIMANAEGISVEEFIDHLQGIQYIDIKGNKNAFGKNKDGELYQVARQLAKFLYEKGVIKNLPKVDNLLDGKFINKL